MENLWKSSRIYWKLRSRMGNPMDMQLFYNCSIGCSIVVLWLFYSCSIVISLPYHQHVPPEAFLAHECFSLFQTPFWGQLCSIVVLYLSPYRTTSTYHLKLFWRRTAFLYCTNLFEDSFICSLRVTPLHSGLEPQLFSGTCAANIKTIKLRRSS